MKERKKNAELWCEHNDKKNSLLFSQSYQAQISVILTRRTPNALSASRNLLQTEVSRTITGDFM